MWTSSLGYYFCPLKGLPPDLVEKDERLPRHLRETEFDRQRRDVFACVKQHMSDTALQQNPLLVMPQSLLHETEKFYSDVNTIRKTCTASLNPAPWFRFQILMSTLSGCPCDFGTLKILWCSFIPIIHGPRKERRSCAFSPMPWRRTFHTFRDQCGTCAACWMELDQ